LSFTSPGLSLRRKISFVQNTSIHVKGRNTVSPERKSMLAAGGSSTRIPCENCIYFLKESCQLLRVFKCQEHHLCAK
jgi:hypothetical protein